MQKENLHFIKLVNKRLLFLLFVITTFSLSNTSFSQTVGVSQASGFVPQSLFHVHSTSAGQLFQLTNINSTSAGASSNGGFNIGLDASKNVSIMQYESAYLYFGTNNTTKMTISSDGNVGVGTAFPNTNIMGGTTTPLIFHIHDQGTTANDGAALILSTHASTDANAALDYPTGYLIFAAAQCNAERKTSMITSNIRSGTSPNISGDLTFWTNNNNTFAERVRIAPAGNVGIGTISPSNCALLDISSSTLGILIPRVALTNVTVYAPVTGTAVDGLLVYSTATPIGGSGTGYYYWSTTASQWISMVDNLSPGKPWILNGNTGITTPATPATYGTSTIGASENFLGTTDAQDIVFGTNNKERMRIKQTNGFIGIGTSTPSRLLHVDGGTATTSGIVAEISGDNLTTGSALYVHSSSITSGYLVDIEATNASGTTSNGLYVSNNSTTGNAIQAVGYGNPNYSAIFAQTTPATDGTGYTVSTSNHTINSQIYGNSAYSFAVYGRVVSAPSPSAGVLGYYGTDDWGALGYYNGTKYGGYFKGSVALSDGHLRSIQTTAPSITAGVGAGTGPTVSLINATDVAGTIKVITGTAPASGTVVTVTYNTAYTTAPIVVFSPKNGNAAAKATVVCISTSTTTGFTIWANTLSASTDSYLWTYMVIETQ